MNEEQKKELWKRMQIIVAKGSMSDQSRCEIKRCKKHDAYLVFYGGTQLSNLHGSCCPPHLSLMVDKALVARNKEVEKQIERARRREIDAAKEVLKIN